MDQGPARETWPVRWPADSQPAGLGPVGTSADIQDRDGRGAVFCCAFHGGASKSEVTILLPRSVLSGPALRAFAYIKLLNLRSN